MAGGGKGYFNHRFAQTTRHGSQHEDNLSPSEFFPFTTTPAYDPETGEKGDTLERARESGFVPKLFFTGTSTEYWTRGSSLLHTDVTGTTDIPSDPNVRIYFIAGGQHGVSGSPDRGIYQNQVNVLDHRPVLRALLVKLDQWASSGAKPPEERLPKIADGTLINLANYRKAFPAIPGGRVPEAMYVPLRLEFGPRWREMGIADFVPPRVGPPFRMLVPSIDADGNELAGIRLPDIAVPIATYTGWNLRSESVGAAGALGRWNGSYFPFPLTAADREKTSDPRLSVAERYPNRERYLDRIAESAKTLQAAGFLLEEDVADIREKSAQRRLWEISKPDKPN